MSRNITRRNAICAGAISSVGMLNSSPTQTKADPLPVIWGDNFLTQWSPPKEVKRDLTPGPTPIRLSCDKHRIDNTPSNNQNRLMSLPKQIKEIRNNGYTAVESESINWLDTSDSVIREMQSALKEFNVLFYTLHQWRNIIHPNPETAKQNIREIIIGIESAERIGVKNIVMHTGGRNPQIKFRPHPENWTKETWEKSVTATKQILKETAGSTVNLCFEAINCCNNNTPQSHLRLQEDVGDSRVKVCLDPTNMVHPGVFFRTTELLNLCFDLLGEDIMLCHAKDSTWDSMSTAINEGAILGKGNLDYPQYLARLSHMNEPRALLIEHLAPEAYQPSKEYLLFTAAQIGVTILS